MVEYKLIGHDNSEASVVRRHLHRWNKTDEQAIMPLIFAIQEKQGLSGIHATEPRWETNVYPLYYWMPIIGNKRSYDRVLERLPNLFLTPNSQSPAIDLRQHLTRTINSEIDILVEDFDYFLFIEAKTPKAGRKTKFQTLNGVHQMVRHYVQGRILEKLIDKPFALATIGANNAEPLEIPLNGTEQALLHLVSEERQTLEIQDLPWTLFTATG